MITGSAEDFPAVAVPVKDEAERLPNLLHSLSRQSWIASAGRALPVVLVVNNSTDGSAEIARTLGYDLPGIDLIVLEVKFAGADANVGSARRLAMEKASDIIGDRLSGVILTTDADATPHHDWVKTNLAALKSGADAVGGLIIGDASEEAVLGDGVLHRVRLHMRYAELGDRLAALVDPLPYDPWPRHRDHTGASLAVRSSVYRKVGGLPALPYREDLAFVSRLRAHDFKLAHPLAVRVGVSARLDGRAPGGMADCLRSWIEANARGAPQLVEAPVDILERLYRRHALRMAADPGVGALIERLAADDPDAPSIVPIEAAIAELAALVASHEAVPDAA